MRIATYNVENLFSRAKVFNLDTWQEGKPTVDAFAEINELFEVSTYSDSDKTRIVQLLKALLIDKKDDGSPFVLLRQNRGLLLKRNRFAGLEIVAKGRSDWTGWVEMKTELVNETATRNTAQVVRDINADIISFCECEGRAALLQFSQKLLPAVNGTPYAEAMLIDGNDTRGIDVGLMTKPGYKVGWMRSHVDDIGPNGTRVFSRDCPEFAVWTEKGPTIWVLVNHFKSKGYGTQSANDARRRMQAETVRTIYERLKQEGAQYICVQGDFNDRPDADALAPLLRDTDLRDASTHPKFDDGGRPGTFQNSTAAEKIDYIMLSPKMYERMSQGGIWRRGVWGGKNGTLWPVYPEITDASHAASDHAALWCDVEF